MSNLSASILVSVPFHDVDAMNVAWHGHYLKYFELARCELLQRIDYDYPQMKDSGFLWPIVECQLKYVRPATYGQRLQVRASLAEYENRIRIVYEIVDAISGERLTKGYTIQVAVDAQTREMQFVSPAILIENVERVVQS